MTVSLTTDYRSDGDHCMTDNGETLYIIKMVQGWNWTVCDGAAHAPSNVWTTIEAAHFYALALYADRLENIRRAAA